MSVWKIRIYELPLENIRLTKCLDINWYSDDKRSIIHEQINKVKHGDYIAIGGSRTVQAVGIIDNASHEDSEIRFINIWKIDNEFKAADNGKVFYNLENDPDAQNKTIEIVNHILQEARMEETFKLLEKCMNLVLTGAPGTGKTFLAWQIASAMTGDPNPMIEENELKKHPHIGFCQFHPSMDYTDFVEGLRPMTLDKEVEQSKVEQSETDKEAKQSKGDKKTKQIGFELRDGIFKEFCRNALKEPKKTFIFIIDEINRGDISKIFGELFFAIDPGYRGIKGRINTQYSNLIEEGDVFKEGFYVPENVYIIGTLNDIDRGVESMDFAIRRRFTWKEITPEYTQDDILKKKITDNGLRKRAKNRMNNLNIAICKDKELGSAFQIGAAYFANLEDYRELAGDIFTKLWTYRIEPLLREYMRGQDNVEKRITGKDEPKNTDPNSDSNNYLSAFNTETDPQQNQQ